MPNPFSFVRNSSLFDNFIGRKSEIEEITNRTLSCALSGGMISIVGLPRIGKTSLMSHMFLERGRPERWIETYQMFPLYISLEPYGQVRGFWGGLASKIERAVQRWSKNNPAVPVEACASIQSRCREAYSADAGDRYTIIEECLEKFSDELGLRMIIIIDELDCLMRYKYSHEDFRMIRSLADYGCIITCSRRTPERIEQATFQTTYFANKGLPIFLGTFDKKDVELYWSHFRTAFGMLEKPEFNRYKELVARYAGCHPNLMNEMNYYAHNSGNISEWRRLLDTSMCYQVEWQFRRSLVNAFKEQMRYLDEQDLKNAAIAAVLGGEGINEFTEEIDILQKYKFLQVVTTEEKNKYFGYDLGAVAGDIQHRYGCLSDFFSHYMRDNYYPLIQGAEHLKLVEKKLRALIRWHLKIMYGSDALDIVVGDEHSLEYQERWEEYYFKDPSRKQAAEEDWSDIKKKRWKTTLNECKSPSERMPIDFISGTSLFHLWKYFISCFWDSFYRNVFDEENFITVDGREGVYIGNVRKWQTTVFNPIHILRNRDSHCNRDFLKPEFIKMAEGKCMQICQAIDNWMAKQGDRIVGELL